MDAIVVCAFFLLLPLLSLRWGYDSRVRPRSTEEQFAAWGFSWSARGVEWDSDWWERAWGLNDAALANQRRLLEVRASAHVRTRERQRWLALWRRSSLRRHP